MGCCFLPKIRIQNALWIRGKKNQERVTLAFQQGNHFFFCFVKAIQNNSDPKNVKAITLKSTLTLVLYSDWLNLSRAPRKYRDAFADTISLFWLQMSDGRWHVANLV